MYLFKNIFSLVMAIFYFLPACFSQETDGLSGEWELVPHISSEIPLYRYVTMEIRQSNTRMTIIQKWGKRRSFTDTLKFSTDGKTSFIPVRNRVWPTNVFMGISMKVGGSRQVKADWKETDRKLRIRMKYPVLSSQGETVLTETHTCSLIPEDDILVYEITRNTRSDDSVIKYILKRKGSRNAYYMRFTDQDWRIQGNLPEKAFLISLQGAANMDNPCLYFIYPETYSFNYTPAVFRFYKDKKYFTFKEMSSASETLSRLKNYVEGYIVWDTSVRTSLIVAYTLAGLRRAVVVTEDMIPMVETAGLELIEDFRGSFTGKNDAEIYEWAYDHYWEECNKDLIVWLGGPHGEVMKPGVADWGMYNKVFFNDLSTNPVDEEEYVLASKLLREMNPTSLVMGWHSYGKDLERHHVTLVSRYGHRVEGLHSLPNLSFSHQVPASRNFEYKNHHNIIPGKQYIPEKKVYITCIQTDGLGIGAWLKPGRGEIPYAWEVIMNYSWLAPAMMEFFYSTATPNDYFIGALSGPGYMYPKAVPPHLLPPLLKEAKVLMDKLDLKVFEIMDYSEGATVEGNTELTRKVVDAYYNYMPDVLGFINGYAPAYTFTVRDRKPLISYDYYLSPSREPEKTAADLHELAAINKERPYFLLMHVREYSNVKRVKEILNLLNDEFEIVPLDIFLTFAGNMPTFKERFLKGRQKIDEFIP